MSLSVGGPGTTMNFSRRGTRTTLGLAGTGLSYVEQVPPSTSRRAGRWLLLIVAVGAAILWAALAHAETVYCSTSFQGYRTCSSPDGYRSFEWENGGRLYGDDNNGNKWTTIPGPLGDTTINHRRGQ